MLRRNNDLIPCVFEYVHGGLRGFRHEIVIECIRPEQDFRSALRTRPFSKPRLECHRSKSRDPSLAWHSYSEFRNVSEYGKLREQISEPWSK